MTDLTLTIGDKNLSSWSFRPWFLMTQAGIPFAEETIFLDRPDSRRILKEKSPTGLVPFLKDSDFYITDSLAIAEYLNEKFPEKQLWPSDTKARAHARSISAEMHSGFSALRTVWPMYFLREGLHHLTSGGVEKDIKRIDAIWSDCRKRFGEQSPQNGPFLFGAFSIADAMYAPVVSRFRTYGPVTLSERSADYLETIANTDAYAQWREGAKEQVGA